MSNENVLHVTDQSFETEVLNASVPVLVDFWATWCGPCRALSPVIDELANDNVGKAKVCKMNTDENPDTPAQYGVRGIPTIILFKDGQVTTQSVGVTAKANLQSIINKAL